MHPVKNDGNLSYNSKNEVLQVKIVPFENQTWAKEFTIKFAPGDLIVDDFGLIRYFTYANSKGERLEFFAYEEDRNPNVQMAIEVGKKAVDFAITLIQVHSYYRKGEELNQKFKTKQLTGRQVVEDAALWYLMKQGNSMMMADGLNAIKGATHFVHKNLVKMFPSIRPNNNITYYDTQGEVFIKGALYI